MEFLSGMVQMLERQGMDGNIIGYFTMYIQAPHLGHPFDDEDGSFLAM